MSDHKHSKKLKKQALIARQRHQQEINQMTGDQARSRDLDREREEELREASLESARIAERTSAGEPVWSAKLQMIRNKTTGKKRMAENRWDRFAATSDSGGRGR